MNPAIEAALRAELELAVADLRASLDGTTAALRARGVELANAARDVGDAVIRGAVSYEDGKDAIGKLGRAVASEVLAASYATKSEVIVTLTKFATGLLRIAAAALA